MTGNGTMPIDEGMMDEAMMDEAMSAPLLLIEDDPDSRDLIRALCAARGYEVDAAADGFLGLRLLSERRHPVVLIDYHLPEMDGYALARLMREIGGGQAEGKVRLVGITADRHGLASRRGADALFDAILAKPLDPTEFHALLDRLTRPEPATLPDAPHPADALWRRRGLPGRPRAALCPDLDGEAAAAVAHAFEPAPAGSADLILVATEAGAESLRALRAAGPGRHLPAIDLTGRLGPVCDATFRVDDAAHWDAVARTVRGFAERRTALAPDLRDAADPAGRLLAALFVGDRALPLGACADPGAPIPETGLSRAALMAAVLALTEAGSAACEGAPGGVMVRLTEAGRAAAVGRGVAAAPTGPAPGGWRAPVVTQAPAPDARPPAAAPPIRDAACLDTLRRAIGEAEVARLTTRLRARLAAAFPAGAGPAALAGEAHALVSAAGGLGFARLAAACGRLQSAGADPDAAEDARRAVREALAWTPVARAS